MQAAAGSLRAARLSLYRAARKAPILYAEARAEIVQRTGITRRRQARRERRFSMSKLAVKEGIICVCAGCNKIMKRIGRVADPRNARISHGICEECARKLYGDIFTK